MRHPETPRPEAWLLSAYRAESHAAWADWLVASQQQLHWRRRELPGRFFRWRIRGNPLSWLDSLPERTPDLILATSMVDLATLKGLHPRLASVPSIYYFHENQFAYPRSAGQVSSVDPQMVQLYGALAAQRLLFNSAFNRDSFLDGVDDLLAGFPDAVPVGLRERLLAKSEVCAVPVAPPAACTERRDRLIVWNHRWEYDKAPELFADAMLALAARGVQFELALVGQRGRNAVPALARLREALPDRIIADGRLEIGAYRRLLACAGIVVSTALHEFQGLAVLEAAAAGARPLVPDALCYPEQYPPVYRYPAGAVDVLVDRLHDWLSGGLPPAVDVSAWSAGALAPAWRRHLSEGQEQHVE